MKLKCRNQKHKNHHNRSTPLRKLLYLSRKLSREALGAKVQKRAKRMQNQTMAVKEDKKMKEIDKVKSYML